MKNTKLTSVKILENLYEKFKLNTVNTKMTLQKIMLLFGFELYGVHNESISCVRQPDET